MKEIIISISVIFLIMNLYAVYITVKDKRCAQEGKWRVPESTLLFVAALSGCVTMYITMKIIRHKTKKPKFMVGIPVIFVLEIAAAVLAVLYRAELLEILMPYLKPLANLLNG